MNVIERITAERKRQIEQENWTSEHDDRHSRGELSVAAAAYAAGRATIVEIKTWTGLEEGYGFNAWDGLTDEVIQRKPRIRQLEIAAALIVAEIERLERLSSGFDNQKEMLKL